LNVFLKKTAIDEFFRGYSLIPVEFFQILPSDERQTKITPEESNGLTGLWQCGFPLKTVKAHYALWAIRARKPKGWFEVKFGYAPRHRRRFLASLRNPKTGNGFRLAPLKPRRGEIYLPTSRPKG
jgi:hypothetical protein